MDFLGLVKKSRSYRRFMQNKKIELRILEEIIESARNAPSAGNIQPLRYCVITNEEICDKLRYSLVWAGSLPEWDGPEEGENPSAYIAICRDMNLPQMKRFDEGIALQTIQLAATSNGLGSCALGSFNKDVTSLLDIPKELELVLIVALGYPNETIVLENCGARAGIDLKEEHKYYRDENDFHHVPKRTLDDVLYKILK